MDYGKTLKKVINKISHPLKKGLDLELPLKKKLTKKEFKLLKQMAQNRNEEEILAELNFSKDEYTRVKTNLIKKLNQERVKQELYNMN